jgi:hypothetical protein
LVRRADYDMIFNRLIVAAGAEVSV